MTRDSKPANDVDDDAAANSEELAHRVFTRVFRAGTQEPPWRSEGEPSRDLVRPGSGYLGIREVLGTVLGLPDARLLDLGNLPQGRDAHRLLALRYFIENAPIWLKHFAWRSGLSPVPPAPGEADLTEIERKIEALWAEVQRVRARASMPDEAWLDRLFGRRSPIMGDLLSSAAIEVLVSLSAFPEVRVRVRERLHSEAGRLFEEAPALLDRLFLCSVELDRYPAMSVGAGRLKYILVADKGEMGVRAVRETAALGKIPVVLHSLTDDANALQVRVANEHGGFAIGLEGSFRESYANYIQITQKTEQAFRERFGDDWQDELSRAALYPGYGPLAENAAAICHFRRRGIVFVGPCQDVVERAGDKRQFRALVQSIDAEAVTPGMVIGDADAASMRGLILDAHARGQFSFPGRLKAANGGGGRGQAIVTSPEALDGAITKVLGEIEANRWDPGVMFEQNIPETTHLEVQVMRDRYGNARHFGMRDCTEQRASQKIQEEAPPALLRNRPELRQRIEETAVKIADRVGYVGAGTVELMYKAGKIYFLEMNTRIQVEHPVTEASHGIRRAGGRIEPLNLVAWQMRLANGEPLDFAQDDIVQTHVAREFRINAEAWNPAVKDPRDGQKGLFLPNAGIFDSIEVPDRATVMKALRDRRGIEDVKIRFDVGFDEGDVLVNKDPTFGKLIVAVRAADGEDAYELLREVSLVVLDEMRIEGRQVRPDGRVIDGSVFKTNIEAHRWVLEHEIFLRHVAGEDVPERHVNWVVAALRKQPPS